MYKLKPYRSGNSLLNGVLALFFYFILYMYVQDPGNDVAYDDAPLETPENPNTQFIRVCLLRICPFFVLYHSGNFCVKT